MFRNLKRSDAAIAAIGIGIALSMLFACTTALGASMRAPVGNPVALSDASVSPDYMRALSPGRSVTKLRQCDTAPWTEYSAYTASGGALGGQHWTDGPFPYSWWAGHGGNVTFDGLTFTNHTTRTVLVAAWCG